MKTIPMKVTDALMVSVIPDSTHQFLMTSNEVAKGYEVSMTTLRRHKQNMSDDLVEGKHFISSVQICHAASAGSSRTTMWTKRGIVRLGFSIRTDRARLFRDWAEDLIINYIEKKQSEFAETERKLQERYLKPPGYEEEIEIIKSTILALGSANKLADRIGMSASVLSLIKNRPWLVSDEKLKGIIHACRNLLSRDCQLNNDAIKELLQIDNGELRLSLYKRMKQGGLV